MRHTVANRPPSSDPITDLVFMLWGVLVSWFSWLDLAALNEGLGACVAALTIVLLIYRIALAHIELHDENTADS